MAHLWPVTKARQQQLSSRAASLQWHDWFDKIGRAIGAHPQAAIAAALGVGVTLGWLIKRR